MKRLWPLLCLLVALPLVAQRTSKPSVKFGPEFKIPGKSTLDDVIGYDNTGFYVLETNRWGSKYTLRLFNHQMALVKSAEVNLDYEGKRRRFEFSVQFNGRIYLFTSFANQKLKKNLLFVEAINPSTLKPDGKMTKVAEIDYSRFGRWNIGEFGYDLSRDKSKLMIHFDLPSAKGENERFGFKVFEEDLKVVWGKDVTLPYDANLFDIERFAVSNDGDAYLLGLRFEDKRRVKRQGNPNYHYEVLAYSGNGEDPNKYTIQLGDRFITDMQIEISDDGDILCAGFYSDLGTFSIKGVYFLRVDGLSKDIEVRSFKPFTIDDIVQHMSERKAKRTQAKMDKGKNVELYNYELDDLIVRSDGGVVMVGEQFYVRVVTVTTTDSKGNTSTRTTYYYYYKDIIVVNIEPDGSIAWVQRIPKLQQSVDDGGYYSSYVLTVVDDRLIFVFNDDPRNVNYRSPGKPHLYTRGENSAVLAVELDPQGNQNRYTLVPPRGRTTPTTRPKVCEQANANELVLFAEWKKTRQFARVTF